ncbi:hypothetical protein [Lysobacter silvisoli]|uniref:hypothetical protein n=1 Tax=Lysobacter silvisoli TaxID=2293254 RepID=UPI001314AEBF|nr:hypothetical protein [Lysobacter silvisoli]
MNAQEVIESYVADVALRLPRKQRSDVAFELRMLLNEELQAKADAAGREADADMAIALARAFGRPGDVAARYRPTLTIIDPEDGRSFLRATVIGMAAIWGLGLLQKLGQPMDTTGQALGAIGQWLGGTVVGSLWWPGVLVVGFAMAAWSRRRSPDSAATWTPRAADHLPGGRAAMVLGLIGIVLGIAAMLEPRWILDLFWGGRAAPAAYEALTYTDTFRQRQGPVLLLLVLFNVPMLLIAIARGRWPASLQRMQWVLTPLTCAAMLWTVFDGPMMMTDRSDSVAKFCLAVIAAISLIDVAVKAVRKVKPAPN